MVRRNWTREELVLAFNLYCKTPFGKIHIRNPDVVELATLIGRTPSAVSWKLANFARLDPVLKQRNIVGATHGGRAEVRIWEEFHNNWEELSFESEQLLANLKHLSIEKIVRIWPDDPAVEGKESEQLVRVRVNQNFFRQMVLASYGYRCCITGLAVPELLNASHIVPWAIDIKNRLNPRNGVCLNALHDRAFDRGLITITTDYEVKMSKKLKAPSNDASSFLLFKYNGIRIRPPDRFAPDVNFLIYHNENVFLK
ncbi:MAG: HNH endonuclease [Dehalococcoidia bacterium]|nr:HNH endonuclease [Dehalococcoidia bacterium]